MPYADVGAAINAYKVLWNYEDKFKNIVTVFPRINIWGVYFKIRDFRGVVSKFQK